MLNGCADYYINVDHEAIKLEADHLVDLPETEDLYSEYLRDD